MSLAFPCLLVVVSFIFVLFCCYIRSGIVEMVDLGEYLIISSIKLRIWSLTLVMDILVVHARQSPSFTQYITTNNAKLSVSLKDNSLIIKFHPHI